MADLSLTPVQKGSDFIAAGDGAADGSPEYVLFTVPNAQPARIESVYLVPQYFDSTVYGDIWVLRFRDPSGIAIWAGASPNIEVPIQSTFELTWARLGVDTAATGLTVWSWEEGESSRAWWTGRLPELVMIADSYVTLQLYRGQALDPPPDIPVSDVAVVWSPASGDTSIVSTVADLIPALAPIPLDEQL